MKKAYEFLMFITLFFIMLSFMLTLMGTMLFMSRPAHAEQNKTYVACIIGNTLVTGELIDKIGSHFIVDISTSAVELGWNNPNYNYRKLIVPEDDCEIRKAKK